MPKTWAFLSTLLAIIVANSNPSFVAAQGAAEECRICTGGMRACVNGNGRWNDASCPPNEEWKDSYSQVGIWGQVKVNQVQLDAIAERLAYLEAEDFPQGGTYGRLFAVGTIWLRERSHRFTWFLLYANGDGGVTWVMPAVLTGEQADFVGKVTCPRQESSQAVQPWRWSCDNSGTCFLETMYGWLDQPLMRLVWDSNDPRVAKILIEKMVNRLPFVERVTVYNYLR